MAEQIDRAACVFGNQIDEKTYEKAVRSKEGYARRFGDDSDAVYHLAAADLPVIGYQCTQSFTNCEVCIEIPSAEQYGIVVSKDNPGLTAAINQAMADMQSDGTMDALKIKWFGDVI